MRESLGVRIVTSDKLGSVPGLFHGFTARTGGTSPAPYASLDLSFTRNDHPQSVIENYTLLARAFELDPASLVIVNHEHGANVIRVGAEDRGRGILREPLAFCDGLITNDPAVTLVTLHADCSCVFLYDPVHHAVGIAHAGWKGTLERVAESLVRAMCREFSCVPAEMLAAIGPCICPHCFEVGADVGESFRSEFGDACIGERKKPGKAFVDIAAALFIQLVAAGLDESAIERMPLCTFEREDLFFSHRRDRGNTGAMAGLIALR